MQEDDYNSRIKNLLTEYPLDYIIYVPGAGGEFLSILISKYSNAYDVLQVKSAQFNRWHTHHSILINEMCASFSNIRNTKLDHAIKETIERMVSNKMDLNKIILASEKVFKQKNKKNLYRLHLTSNDFFTKDNSFLLNLNSHWLNYASLLFFLKVYNSHIVKFSIEFNVNVTRLRYHKRLYSSLDSVVEFLKTSDINHITLAHLEIANMVNDLDLNSFLRLSPRELFDQYSQILLQPYYSATSYPKWQKEIALRTNVIDYDKIFTKGYLEEMFDIQSDEFHKELIQWHEDNLKLIKDYGLGFK